MAQLPNPWCSKRTAPKSWLSKCVEMDLQRSSWCFLPTWLLVPRPSSSPRAPLPPNTATSSTSACCTAASTAQPPSTFGIAALSPARAPKADREIASPFTPGKRSGTKVPLRALPALAWSGAPLEWEGYHLCRLDTLISSGDALPQLSCIEQLSYPLVLCALSPSAALSPLMDAALSRHDSPILDWIIIEFRFELTENKKLDPDYPSPQSQQEEDVRSLNCFHSTFISLSSLCSVRCNEWACHR